MEYLKRSYSGKLWAFLALHIAAFVVLIISKGDVTDVMSMAEAITEEEGLIALLASVGVLLLNGIFSPNAKAIFVFWRYPHPLPGCRAFSHYMLNDPRINQQTLRNQYGELPEDPIEQNNLWFSMYKSVEAELTVMEGQRDFLNMRDFCAFSLLFLIGFGGFALISDAPQHMVGIYVAALFIQYVGFAFAARHYGERFVTNVLTVISQKPPQVSS